MISRAFKLRFRRRLRMRKLQVEELGQQAEQQLERNFFRRLERLAGVRRFVLTWVGLVVLLGACIIAQLNALRGYYQVATPTPGGTYTEGILGAFTNASPLYATSPVDTSVSQLLFSGLLTYDRNNNLVGDLAKSWSVDGRGTTYTVHLRPHVTWHDGAPLTAADVVFTYKVIQNPDAQSPLGPSWKGVVVKAVDPLTVTFTLPGVLSSFPYSLTNGIVPRHVLEGKPMSALRTLPFNTTEPIGTGPFKFSTLEVTGGSAEDREDHIALDPFENYYAGQPKLSRFIIHSFRSEDRLTASFKKHEVTAMVGLTTVPAELKQDAALHTYSLPLTAAAMSFFKTSEGVLSDVKVRRALVAATDRSAILRSLDYATLPVNEPLLLNQLGYDPNDAQPGYGLADAQAQLTADGWMPGKHGIRTKAGKPLTFDLYAQEGSEYAGVAKLLRSQWRLAGVDVRLVLLNNTEFQAALNGHTYEAILYGISIGKDPDVLVYWDSKYAASAESRLNFSEYKSPTVDAALQAGRTRTDPALRIIKYRPFLQAWRDDAPAVGLYQPRFLYVTHVTVHGLDEHAINAEVQRYTNVQNWMIREKGTPQVP